MISEVSRGLYKNKIQYPKEFIDKCLELFPEDDLVKDLLDENSFALVGILDERKSEKLSAEEVLEAHSRGSMDDIVQKAKRISSIKELYKDFSILYDEQYHSKGNYIKGGKVLFSKEVLHRYQVSHKILPSKKESSQILVMTTE